MNHSHILYIKFKNLWGSLLPDFFHLARGTPSPDSAFGASILMVEHSQCCSILETALRRCVKLQTITWTAVGYDRNVIVYKIIIRNDQLIG